ncbi:MAG: hypothetical protein MJA29_05705, partial [Candidatus Omnitrophica bacterium]|nr:hypothetical protein [Candidatus Omnitrophota bacterium]
ECLGLSIAELSALINQEPGIYICKFCSPRTDEDFRLGLLSSNPGNTIYEYIHSLQSQPQSPSFPSQPIITAPMSDPSLISTIVSQVLETLLPKLTEFLSESVQEAVEIQQKKNNIVLVGLDERNDAETFVKSTCSKLNIDCSDVAEVFRDGQVPQGGRSRIVKVKFRNLRSRRSFLTGFLGARSGLPGGTKVYARPDLTYRQRQKDRKLREELKERRERGENVKIAHGSIVSVSN